MPATVTPADTDDFGAPLPTDAQFAARVVSLNPAATEAIFALQADSLLVGRSRWDTFPREAARVPALGDGIRPNVEAVLAVRPTLVILYATPDNRAAAEAFARAGVRTITLRVDRLADFHRQLRILGVALGATASARTVSDSVQATLDRVRRVVDRHIAEDQRKVVIWPVWTAPPMVIGGGSYLDELLVIAGARNVFHDVVAPSLTVSAEEIIRRAPAWVIAGRSGIAALRESRAWQSLPAVVQGRVIEHDADLTGRPSVVLGMAAVHLATRLHPALADSLR